MSKKVQMAELSPLITQALSNGKEVILNISGSSMQPLLYEHRDKVCIIKPQKDTIKKYTVVLYVNNNSIYKLHRIIALNKNGLVMAGDHQWIKEYPIMTSQILGVMKGYWRKGKYISCCNYRYCLYSWVWVNSFLLRKLFMKGIFFLNKL